MKILWVTPRVPWPLEKGDKLRAYHQLRQLSRRHENILVALSDAPLHSQAEAELSKVCRAIHVIPLSKPTIARNMLRGLFSRLPLQVAYFTDAAAKRALDALIEHHRPDAIFFQLIRTAEYARGIEGIPCVLDYMDTFSKGVERRIAKVNAFIRPIFRLEWQRLLGYEREAFALFAGHTVISEQDRTLLPLGPDRTRVTLVPNGVDTEFFSPTPRQKDYELLFNGNMNYPPNVEASTYCVKHILPLVWAKKPDVKLLISGANPAAQVQALASDRVTVTGWVDDVRDSFARSRLLVAPMQSSIGLQNKILEAMAMRLPCLTTTLSNNAIKAVPGREIVVADTSEQFADAIVRLLDNPDQAEALAENGYRLVRERFSWDPACRALERVLLDAGTASRRAA